MTLTERYEEAKRQPKVAPTPAEAFVKEVAAIAKCTDLSVRRWISGKVLPDALTRSVLADHFGCTEQELFPAIVKEKASKVG